MKAASIDAPNKPKAKRMDAYFPARGSREIAASLAVSIGIWLTYRVAAVATIIKKATKPVKKEPMNTSHFVYI